MEKPSFKITHTHQMLKVKMEFFCMIFSSSVNDLETVFSSLFNSTWNWAAVCFFKIFGFGLHPIVLLYAHINLIVKQIRITLLNTKDQTHPDQTHPFFEWQMTLQWCAILFSSTSSYQNTAFVLTLYTVQSSIEFQAFRRVNLLRAIAKLHPFSFMVWVAAATAADAVVFNCNS